MSSWPHIESLEFDQFHRSEATITFHGLFSVLCPCPHRHTLQIFRGAMNIDMAPNHFNILPYRISTLARLA
ncbi:hypothetical protein M405DRAFT_469011 [Rhizopogon salebrosus TDB-379]|nr:hypothetical protein M405DRAFT_469011 [Rhizopogon salebrosus TDB-379]